ncbi:MAG: ABC transporter permease [bacterium]|nr:ABC transporter permease [bacterium]
MSERRITAPPVLNQQSGHEMCSEARSVDLAADDILVVDFSRTEAMDSGGAAWLLEAAEAARKKGAAVECRGAQGDVSAFLSLVRPSLDVEQGKARRDAGPLEKLGDVTLRFLGEARQMLDLLADAVYWTVLAPFEGRGFRWGLFLDELYEMGVRAVQINSLMCFLLGLTIAMLSAAQLRPLGLDIYTADMLIIGFSRELAVIMTAVVVSARTGAAIAAELATMKVQEEIDALRGMGLSVPQFLYAPKLLAMIVVMPCLTIIGLLAGIAGGAVWGTVVLGYKLQLWLDHTLVSAAYGDLFQGLMKSFFFANVIVLVGCHNGMRVKGGSRGVGLMTTRAVVMDIFFLIVIDMMFAALFYYILE